MPSATAALGQPTQNFEKPRTQPYGEFRQGDATIPSITLTTAPSPFSRLQIFLHNRHTLTTLIRVMIV